MTEENWQTRANEFARERNLRHPAGVYALDVMSELGEVAKEILLNTHYGAQPARKSESLQVELGDLLYSLCMLATSTGIDLEEAFSGALRKYDRRWHGAGNIGSDSAGLASSSDA